MELGEKVRIKNGSKYVDTDLKNRKAMVHNDENLYSFSFIIIEKFPFTSI